MREIILVQEVLESLSVK